MATGKSKNLNLGTVSMDRAVSAGGTATDSPILQAEEVQNVVSQNARNEEQNAANAAALQVEGNPLQLSNIGRNGNGNWYSLVGPGGTVKPENAAAFLAMGPGAYSSPYAPAMQELMNQLLNPEQFKYDVNADGLYQQIKDNYTKAGRQAMMDTQGQSAALTGGYGNSYGAMAGQQAYQESLGSMAGMIPELQQLAYQQWLNGEDAKRNNLEALNKLDAQEYARWQDEMAAYQEMLKTVPDPSALGGAGGIDPGVIGVPTEATRKNLMTMGTGTGNNNFVVNPGQQEAIASYLKNTGLTIDNLAYDMQNGINITGADPQQVAYYINTHSGVSPAYTLQNAGQLYTQPAQTNQQQGAQTGAQQGTAGTGQQTSSQSVAQRNTEFLKNIVQGIKGIFGQNN